MVLEMRLKTLLERALRTLHTFVFEACCVEA
jgi:hypothetical protein